jgi:hypothetical protein
MDCGYSRLVVGTPKSKVDAALLSRRINMERATNREKTVVPDFVFIAMILVSVVGLLYVFVHQ